MYILGDLLLCTLASEGGAGAWGVADAAGVLPEGANFVSDRRRAAREQTFSRPFFGFSLENSGSSRRPALRAYSTRLSVASSSYKTKSEYLKSERLIWGVLPSFGLLGDYVVSLEGLAQGIDGLLCCRSHGLILVLCERR